MSQIKRPKHEKPSGQVLPPKTQPTDEHISFSLKYYDTESKKFSLQLCGKGYLEEFIPRLHEISKCTVMDMLRNASAYRFHKIVWSMTSEKNGFSHLSEQVNPESAFQFSIDKSNHGRIHGFLIKNVFFIVWIDPKHQLYPRD